MNEILQILKLMSKNYAIIGAILLIISAASYFLLIRYKVKIEKFAQFFLTATSVIGLSLIALQFIFPPEKPQQVQLRQVSKLVNMSHAHCLDKAVQLLKDNNFKRINQKEVDRVSAIRMDNKAIFSCTEVVDDKVMITYSLAGVGIDTKKELNKLVRKFDRTLADL